MARDPLTLLLHDLRDGDAETRIRAAKALYEWGPRVAPVTQSLIAALADPEDKVREHVVNALTEIGPPALRPLAKAVSQGETSTRLLAIDVCDRICASSKVGKSIEDISSALIFCLGDNDSLIKRAAVRCLGDLRAGAGVPRLVKLLEETKDREDEETVLEIRLDAIIACGQIGEEANQAVPVLARMAVSGYRQMVGDLSIGAAAADALAGIGEPATPALARLIVDVNLDPGIRRNVLFAVGRESRVTGKKFPTLAPAFCQALADQKEEIRWAALYALTSLGSADQRVCAALQLAATADKSPHVRIEAATVLHRFDPRNHVTLPVLLRALEDKKASVRVHACTAVGAIGAPAAIAIPKLIPLVSDGEEKVRLAAIKGLGWMGPGLVSAIPALQVAMDDPNPEVRQAAREGMKRASKYAPQPP